MRPDASPFSRQQATSRQAAGREETDMMQLRLGLLAALVLLGACNTIQGAGRDIKSVGQAIDKSAGAAKD
jgi:predicted small secreted protein